MPDPTEMKKLCPKSGLALYQFDGMPTTETWEARCDECGQVVTIERYSIIPWHYMPEPLGAAIALLSDEDQRKVTFALHTPDLYPARNIADYLGVTIGMVHSYRREHGLRKARS